MFPKTFKCRRPGGLRILAVVAAAVAALLLVYAWRVQGRSALWPVMGAVAMAGLSIWFIKQRTVDIAYEISEKTLVMRRGSAMERLALETVLDVSLVDRPTAKGLIANSQPSDLSGTAGPATRPGPVDTRYCSLSVTASHTASALSGLSPLDMRDFNRSMVLLRVREGRAYLLSPKHANSMVACIGKLLSALPTTEPVARVQGLP